MSAAIADKGFQQIRSELIDIMVACRQEKEFEKLDEGDLSSLVDSLKLRAFMATLVLQKKRERHLQKN